MEKERTCAQRITRTLAEEIAVLAKRTGWSQRRIMDMAVEDFLDRLDPERPRPTEEKPEEEGRLVVIDQRRGS